MNIYIDTAIHNMTNRPDRGGTGTTAKGTYMEHTEYAPSPRYCVFLRRKVYYRNGEKLCQLKKQVHCITNFMEKNTLHANFLLVNSMKKKVGFYYLG